ncbi:expressed protein [Phakopsora pachyrhizi]|uniref:Expressed protein n=1 Tax=Phakopsora pachyrhizi TaxID=170000 RepID=A0AAV0BGL1_PHAPC|nr:expressed protein [Phakopsora pachyrhizi]
MTAERTLKMGPKSPIIKPSKLSTIEQYLVSASNVDFGKKNLKIIDSIGKVAWETVRELVHDEIVESLLDSSGQVHWTIHRPIRGWYLILRSPFYSDPQVYISLKPTSSIDQDQFTVCLRACHIPQDPIIDDPQTKQIHSSPVETTKQTVKNRSTSIYAGTPSPSKPEATLLTGSSCFELSTGKENASSTINLKQRDIILILKSLSTTTQKTFFQSISSLFTDNSRSFVCAIRSESTETEKILTMFEDKPSMFGFNNDGSLSLHSETISKVGMPISFWLAISLAYLGFRDDKEVSAAVHSLSI